MKACRPWSHDWDKWEDIEIHFTYPKERAVDGEELKIVKQGQSKNCTRCGMKKRRFV